MHCMHIPPHLNYTISVTAHFLLAYLLFRNKLTTEEQLNNFRNTRGAGKLYACAYLMCMDWNQRSRVQVWVNTSRTMDATATQLLVF